MTDQLGLDLAIYPVWAPHLYTQWWFWVLVLIGAAVLLGVLYLCYRWYFRTRVDQYELLLCKLAQLDVSTQSAQEIYFILLTCLKELIKLRYHKNVMSKTDRQLEQELSDDVFAQSKLAAICREVAQSSFEIRFASGEGNKMLLATHIKACKNVIHELQQDLRKRKTAQSR